MESEECRNGCDSDCSGVFPLVFGRFGTGEFWDMREGRSSTMIMIILFIASKLDDIV